MPKPEAILDQQIRKMTDPVQLKSILQDTRKALFETMAARDAARKVTEDVAQQRTDATLELGEKTLWNARLSRLYAKALLEIVKAEDERNKARRNVTNCEKP